jgi:hypothetical protein
MLNRFYLFYISFFVLLSTYGVPLAAPYFSPIETRRSSGIFTS